MKIPALNALTILVAIVNCGPQVGKKLARHSWPLFMPMRNFQPPDQNIGIEVDSSTTRGHNVPCQIYLFVKVRNRKKVDKCESGWLLREITMRVYRLRASFMTVC